MSELKIDLEAGECNGYMNTEIYVNDQLICCPNFVNSNNLILDIPVNFPFDLRIQVSGKNLNTDTHVEDGKIVRDKYVKLKQLYVARYPVNEGVLYNMCLFHPQDKPAEKTNYFYCNGSAVLNFQAPDAMKWLLLYNRYWSC